MNSCRAILLYFTVLMCYLGKKLLDIKDSLTDLLRTMSSCTEFEVLLQQAVKREGEAAAKLEKVIK